MFPIAARNPADYPNQGYSMPVTEKSTIATVLFYEGQSGEARYDTMPCSGTPKPKWFGDETGLVTWTQTIIQDNDTSRRKRPVPLYSNPTSMAYQYHFVARAGHHKSAGTTQRYQAGPGYTAMYGSGCKPLTSYVVQCTVHSYPLNKRLGGLYTSMISQAQIPSDLWSQAMRQKIKGLSQNIGESVFEYRQTCSLFHDSVQEIYRAWKALRRPATYYRKSRKVRKVNGKTRVVWVTEIQRLRQDKRYDLKTAGKGFIATEFGVLPLMSDVYESCERLKNALGTPLIQRVVVTRRKANDYSSKLNYGNHRNGVATLSWMRSQRAVCYVRLSTAHTEFTIGNPAEIAYNLTAWSFIVDWFIPIGQWLSSLDALKSVTGVIGAVTTRERYKLVDGSHPESTDVLVEPALSMEEGISRAKITSIPIAPFPSWSPSESYQKLAIALGLLASMRQGEYARRATR